MQRICELVVLLRIYKLKRKYKMGMEYINIR